MSKDIIELAGATYETAAELKRRLHVTENQVNRWQKKGLQYVMIGNRRYFERQGVDLFVLRLNGVA